MRQLVFLILSLFSISPLSAQISNISTLKGSWAEGLHQYFLGQTEEGFSGSVWISQNGVPILTAGYGYANREKQIPFTVHTISTIGSITKPLTGTAIAYLHEQGKLHVRDRIGKYIAGLPPKLSATTIHQMLLHSSGLGNIMVNDDFKLISKSDFVERLKKEKLKFEPGAKSKYSNIGFSVLGYIIEEDIFIAVMSNSSRANGIDVIRPIRRALVQGEREPIPE